MTPAGAEAQTRSNSKENTNERRNQHRTDIIRGIPLMTLANDFEQSLEEALLDDVEQRAREEIAPTVQAHAHEILERYGQRHDYNVETKAERMREKAEGLLEEYR